MTSPDAHQLLRELAASRELTRQLAERVAICSELLSRAAVRLDWPREEVEEMISRMEVPYGIVFSHKNQPKTSTPYVCH